MAKRIVEGNQKKISNDKIELIERKLFLSKQKEKEKMYIELTLNQCNQTHSEKYKENFKIIMDKIFYPRKDKKIKKDRNIVKSTFKINLILYYFFLLSLISQIASKRNNQLNILSNDIEITVKVNGAGTKQVLSSFFENPHSILINGVNKTFDSDNQIYINNAEKGSPIKIMWHGRYLTSTYAMFYQCNDITEIDLSKVDTSSVIYMDHMFRDCTSLISVNLNNLDTTKVISMNFTFSNCIKLESLDLSGFNTINVKSMYAVFYNCIKLESLDLSGFNTENVVIFPYMFANCFSLESIDLSKFQTISAKIFQSMFENCTELTSLDLSKFDTSLVMNFQHMFYNCAKLEYINLNNFKDSMAIYYSGMFSYIPKNPVICLGSSNTPTLFKLASHIPCVYFACVSYWKYFQKTISSDTGTCTDFCSKSDDKYEYNGYCYENCPSGTLATNNKKICYDCDPDCKECESTLTYCSSCKDSDKFLNNGKCISSCTYGYYTDSNSNKICCNLEKCSGCTKDSLDDKLCTACYSGYYPKYEDKGKPVFDCYQNLDGYFLIQDNGKSYYKQCYSRCKKCNSEGNDKLHKCLECQSNYNFEIEFNSYKNCYEKCSNYYYLDDDNQIHCINKCPTEYSKLITAKGECVNNCNKYSNYKYEYNDECYQACPTGTKAFQNNICVSSYEYKNNYYEVCPSNTKTDNEDMKCYDKCPDSKFEYDSTCVSNCPEGTYRFFKDKRTCITNLQENYYLDKNDNNLYKECYESCKKCLGGGNILNNNCEECKNGFMFLSEFLREKSCFECSYYYYVDNSGTFTCTNDLSCPQDYKYFISEKNKCINKCKKDSKYKYEYIDKCYETCPTGTIESQDNICIQGYEYKNNYYEVCPSSTKTDNEDMKCYDECPAEKFEYGSTCVSNCPEGTYRFFKSKRTCITNLQENYYLDENDDIYKECHENCKNCKGEGNDANNNCDECKSGFMFLSEPGKEKNCFKCSNYYYIDNSGTFTCTNSKTCPQAHKNFISEKNKCINKCKKDSKYKYEYIDKCYETCPTGTLLSQDNICIQGYEYNNNYYKVCPSNTKTDNEDMKCYDECPDEKFEYDSTCVSNCPEGTYRFFKNKRTCITNLQENYYLDKNDNNLYKECYENCKKCEGGGNDSNNNCKECKTGFIFLFESGKTKNCFECSYYYYIDDSDIYHCTNGKTCPQAHKNIISERKKCINKCINDNSIYKYEYKDKCYEACPDKTKAFHDDMICLPAYKYNNQDYEKCPSNTKTDNEEMECYDECPEKKFEYESTCLSDCPKDTYRFLKDRRRCITNLQENYYLDKNDNIHKECHENCKKCEVGGDNTNNNCEVCKSGFMFLSEPDKEKNCFNCSYYYYFFIDSPNDFFCTENFTCPTNHKNFISEKKKCINICENDNIYKFEYNNTCYIECPIGTEAFGFEPYICIQLYEYINNNTYYRECPSIFKSDHEVKKCYDECPEYKFEYNNSCWTNCPNNTYRFFIDRNRCLETLLENYYLDENDNIYKKCYDYCQKCYGKGNETNNNCKECIEGFMFLYEPTQGNNCFNCSYYYYIEGSNNFRCTEKFNCPNMHKKFVAEKKKCINLCQYDSIYTLDYNGNCTIKCPNGTYISDDKTLCINNDASDADIFERKVENALNMIMNAGFGYNDSIGIMAFKVSDKLTMFAGYIEDMKNNTNRNSSSLDLGNCTDKLKEHYNLSENHPLVVILKNYKPEGFLIPKTDYEILDPINSRILNLSYCENSKATVYVPADIDKNEEYLYDPSSGFYNDICYSYTSENGTDITQKDRQDEYVSKKLSLCDNNCKYEGYDEISQQSICTCDIQNKPGTMDDLIDDEVQRPEEFTSDEGSNLITTDNLKCLSLKGLKTVILSYILIMITLYFLFSIVTFVKCGFRKLKDDINKIISAKEREMMKNINNQITRGNNNIYNNNLYNIRKNNIKNSPPVKGKVRFMTNEVQDKRYHRVLRSDKMSKMSSFNKMILFKEIINKVEPRNKNVQNKMGFPSKNTSIKNIKNNFINYNFSEYELSIMAYQEAFIYDKRSCCKYYIYLLRIKHPILFSFCPTKDYNTLIIKSCIFFLSLAFHFLINFLFFTEDVIHQIYEDGGRYNYIYFIPKISISFAISNIITIMTKFLFLSESNIIEIKRQKSLIVAHNRTFKVISRLRCKYIFFFLLGSIFLISCWILVSSFGVIYQNTELILLKNTLISFLISFIYPFFMNIFPSMLRICSLSTKKHNLGCIYNLSKILQYL